jgi:hypothetical protein
MDATQIEAIFRREYGRTALARRAGSEATISFMRAMLADMRFMTQGEGGAQEAGFVQGRAAVLRVAGESLEGRSPCQLGECSSEGALRGEEVETGEHASYTIEDPWSGAMRAQV